MLAPGFNRWGQVFLHFGTSPPSRIQPKPLAAKMQPGPAADPKPQAWCEAEGWAELNQCGTSPAFGSLSWAAPTDAWPVRISRAAPPFGRAKPRGEDGEGGLESPEGQHPTGATRGGCSDMNIRDDG